MFMKYRRTPPAVQRGEPSELGRHAFSLHAQLHLQQTARVGGDDRRRLGRLYRLHLDVEDLHGFLVINHIVNPGRPAAHIRLAISLYVIPGIRLISSKGSLTTFWTLVIWQERW